MNTKLVIFHLAFAAMLSGALVWIIFIDNSSRPFVETLTASLRASIDEISEPPRYFLAMFLVPLLYMLLLLAALAVVMIRGGRECSRVIFGVFFVGLALVAITAAFTETFALIAAPTFVVAFAAWEARKAVKHVGT